jgi:hypothetical protein
METKEPTMPLDVVPMTNTRAQTQLLEILRDQEAIRDRLAAVAAALPPSPGDGSREDDSAVGRRDVIDCILADSIRPAIADIRRAAFYPEEPPADDGDDRAPQTRRS